MLEKPNIINEILKKNLFYFTRPWLKEGEPVLMEESVLKNIAEKHGKSPAQILLRFQVTTNSTQILRPKTQILRKIKSKKKKKKKNS